MEPQEIKNIKKWWDWITKNPLKALGYLVLVILLVFILTPYITGFFGEKGEQSARSPKTENQSAEDQTGDIHQTATGDGSIQMATTGDNSPIIYYRKEVPDHRIKANRVCYKKPEGDHFLTKIELSSQSVIPNVYFAVYAKTIITFNILPQRSGAFMTGHSGKREGYWFTNIPNFGGKYSLIIQTKESEDIRIEYDIQ